MKTLLKRIVGRLDERLRRFSGLKRFGLALFRRFPLLVGLYTLVTGRYLPGLEATLLPSQKSRNETFDGWALEADPQILAQWEILLKVPHGASRGASKT